VALAKDLSRYQVDGETQRRFGELNDTLEDLWGAAEPPERSVAEADYAKQDGSHKPRSQAGERHDGRRAPSGTEYTDGILRPRRYPPPAPSPDELARSADLLAEILRDVIHVAWPHEWAEAEQKIETLLRDGPPKPDADPKYLLRVRTAIKGPLPEWAVDLEHSLMANAWFAAEDRLRAAHKDPVPPGVIRHAPQGAEQIWGVLQHEHGEALPPQVTPAAIASMLDGVALNRGGRKDVAHRLVLKFLKSLEK